VPHLDESHFVLALTQRFHDPVDAIAGRSEDHINAPSVNRVDENIGSSSGHNGGYVDGSDGPCDWSPDGTSLVYEKQGAIYIFQVSTSESKFLTEGHDPTWSPNGNLIAYRREDTTAALISREGVRMSWPVSSFHPVSPLRWSPDGRYVSFAESVPERIPLIGTYYRLVVCRVSDGKVLVARKFGAGAGDTRNFHWIVDYRKFCSHCATGEPFN